MRLLIIGAGGQGKIAADCAESMGIFSQIMFLDDNHVTIPKLACWDVVDSPDNASKYIDGQSSFFVAIGNNQARASVQASLNAMGARLVTLIHPSAVVSQYTKIGEGTLVNAGAIINVLATIGEGCIINTAATIDHDCILADFVHLAPGVHLAGTVTIGRESFLGIGTVAIPNISIGHSTVIGAGSTVLVDVPDKVVAVGSPVKVIKNANC
jgi:UDP-N-acetylbacillosamine N-acetyltransferase